VTIDVDVIVEIASRGDYYRLADSLRSAGFSEDSREGIERIKAIANLR
jgi:hypothetical protein